MSNHNDTSSHSAATKPPTPPRNHALRMLGLPALPRKLPSRNWLIFWSLTTGISAAIIYDRREKKRTIARWSHAVEHLAREPLSSSTAQLRKLTIFLSAPPGDSLRYSQDHYSEYVKPILAASGLDWDFVQGRREGDVRAVVAENVRKIRRAWADGDEKPSIDTRPTRQDMMDMVRRDAGIDDYQGVMGDIIIGRHTWKEYIRGLHEGWLGSLQPPAISVPVGKPDSKEEDGQSAGDEESRDELPPQPKPHNNPLEYPLSTLPRLTPAEFAPTSAVPEPHILGFFNMHIRMRRFFHQRALADQIGREIAAACLCTYRDFREQTGQFVGEDDRYEQQRELGWEEKDWIKTVWKEEDKQSPETEERVRARPIVMDPRIAMRMRRFDLRPEDEERARQIMVPEEEVEGWIKGSLRRLWRWGTNEGRPERAPTVPVDEADARG